MLDMLSEIGMLGCKATDTLMDLNLKLLPNQGSSWKTKEGMGD